MAPRLGSIAKKTEEMMEKVEELLCSGIAPGRIEKLLSKQPVDKQGNPVGKALSPRQVRRIISKVYESWQVQTVFDAPHRREKIVRMTERLYAKSLSPGVDKDGRPLPSNLPAALGALNLMARMSGAFAQHDPEREKKLLALGPPPLDQEGALLYAQKCMLLSLEEVVTNPTLDPERRMRWVAEIGYKIGATYDRTRVAAMLEEMKGRMLGASSSFSDELTSRPKVRWPATSGFGSEEPEDGPAGRAVPGPDEEEDGGDPSGGGGPLGPH